MLPSNEHTFILQIVNTYSHGYVTSQCDITYISWTYWVQILPINVQYYQSAFMPFIECIALLLLELQDPLYYESLYKAGFYVRESTALCCWRDGRTVGCSCKGSSTLQTPKKMRSLPGGSCSCRLRKFSVSDIGSGREECGRQWVVIKHRCTPWRTAFW